MYEAPLANIKMGRQRWQEKPLIPGRSGAQCVVMVTKLLKSSVGLGLVDLSLPKHIGRPGPGNLRSVGKSSKDVFG